MAVLNVEKSLLGGEVGGEGDDDIGEVGEARLGMLCLSLHLTGMSLENTKSTEQCSVGCFRKTLFQKNKKRNPPSISLGVSLNRSKRFFSF